MSVHEPPSSYMLRKMSEVTVPDHVSWFPQTIGWKIVAIILFVFSVYCIVAWIKKWWANRYRREASCLLNLISSSVNNPSLSYEIFEVMKAVLTHISAKNATLFKDDFLIALDSYSLDGTGNFNNELGQQWMRSLVQQQYALSEKQLTDLTMLCQQWLSNHVMPTVNKNGGEDAV
jgi:hypothetical protein